MGIAYTPYKPTKVQDRVDCHTKHSYIQQQLNAAAQAGAVRQMQLLRQKWTRKKKRKEGRIETEEEAKEADSLE